MEKTIWVNGAEFILVEVSKLNPLDDFIQHQPRTVNEENLKNELVWLMAFGLKDFYRPKIDPSFDSEGKICYQDGLEPAVGKSYNWWEKTAKKFSPVNRSRLGTKSEYVVFLGVLIKKLVESGWKVDTAWNAVCNYSKNLGHYRDSEGARHDFEPTGSRCICGFCDLANTYKILAEDVEESGFWLGGGDFGSESYRYPLADLYDNDSRILDCYDSVGWLVLEK